MANDRPFGTLPVVDVTPLRPASSGGTQAAGSAEVARQIEAACREHGFFYVTGHGVAPDLLARLTTACAAFFALPQAAKMEIAMRIRRRRLASPKPGFTTGSTLRASASPTIEAS